MGTGYTRNDAANNIADSNIINASDLDGEFDAVEAAFNSTTGHTHDGTSAEGAPIEVIGPTQDVVITASVMRPKTTNTVDLGTSSLEFKDAYFDGTITTDALTVTDGITSDTVTVLSENAGAAKGPQLDIFRDSASPADSDVLGHIDFSGKDDGDNKTIYASILAEAADVTDTTEDGVLKFNTMVDGSDTTTMTITESKVGIGTSSPSESLTNRGNIFIETNSTSADSGNGLFWQSTTSGWSTSSAHAAIYGKRTDASNGYIRFDTRQSGTTQEAMRIDSSGQVGIGTSSPSSYDNAGDNLVIAETSGGAGLTLASSTSGSGHILFADGTTGTGAYDGFIRFDHTTSSMRFASGGGTERMRIDSDGNVGIGTSSPDRSLHIAGNPAQIIIEDTGGGTNDKRAALFTDSGVFEISSKNDDDSTRVNDIFCADLGTGNIGIGTNSPSKELHVVGASTPEIRLQNSDNNYALDLKVNATVAEVKASSALAFLPAGSEAARFDSSGNVGIGTTSNVSLTSSEEGFWYQANDWLAVSRSAGTVAYLNRLTSDGNILDLRKDGTTVGSIGAVSSRLYIGTSDTAIRFKYGAGDAVVPANGSGALRDNQMDLGATASRWDDIYATNGTIQTSDENEKQQIASLTDAEITAAKAISKLFKTFKWNDSVTEKGDAARTHAGVIAQQVETAMSDAGLDAGNYAFFISTTWWETQTEVPAVEAVEAQDAVYEDVIIPAVEEVLDEEGNVVTEAQPERTEQRLVSEAVEAVEGKEAYTRTDTYDTLEEAPEGATERNRKGIRYPELLSFIGAATEQRLTSIEARLDALENA